MQVKQPDVCCQTYNNVIPVSLRLKDGSWYLAWKCLGCEGLYDITFNTTRKVILIQEVRPVSNTVLNEAIDIIEHYPLDSFQLKNLLEVGINIFMQEQESKLAPGSFVDSMNCPNCNYAPIETEEGGEKYITCKVCGIKYKVTKYISGNITYDRVKVEEPVLETTEEIVENTESTENIVTAQEEYPEEEAYTESTEILAEEIVSNQEKLDTDSTEVWEEYTEDDTVVSSNVEDTINQDFNFLEGVSEESSDITVESEDTITIKMPSTTPEDVVATTPYVLMNDSKAVQNILVKSEQESPEEPPVLTLHITKPEVGIDTIDKILNKKETTEFTMHVIHYYMSMVRAYVHKDRTTGQYTIDIAGYEKHPMFDNDPYTDRDVVVLSASSESSVAEQNTLLNLIHIETVAVDEKGEQPTFINFYIEVHDSIQLETSMSV